MATKKKSKRAAVRKAPARKAAPAKRRAKAPRRVLNAPLPASQRVETQPPKRNGYILVGFVVIVIAAVFLRNCRENEAPLTAPAAADIKPAMSAPPGRSPLEPSAEKQRAASAAAAAARGAAESAHRAPAGETGQPALEFDRSAQKALTVHCWRPAQGMAQLDVFGPRNQRVRTLRSDAGEAGWRDLKWDGKDDAGKAVPAGLYYVRPSSPGLQQVRDVWVKG